MPPKKDHQGAAASSSKWDNTAHEAVCTALCVVLDNNKIPLSANQGLLVDAVKARGLDFTWEAIRQHLQKLKRKEPGPPPTPGADGDAKASGSKAKRKATPKRKKAAANDDDDDADEPETPTKKPKKQAKEEDHSNIKFEPQMDEDDEAGVA